MRVAALLQAESSRKGPNASNKRSEETMSAYLASLLLALWLNGGGVTCVSVTHGKRCVQIQEENGRLVTSHYRCTDKMDRCFTIKE